VASLTFFTYIISQYAELFKLFLLSNCDFCKEMLDELRASGEEDTKVEKEKAKQNERLFQ